MFACLYSLSTPLTALVALAESFTPRFEVTGSLVMLDVSGLSRLLGSFKEIGEQLRRASPGPVRIAIAPTQTAAALLALSRAGLTVIEAGGQSAALAPLPVSVLGELDRLNVVVDRPPTRAQNFRASFGATSPEPAAPELVAPKRPAAKAELAAPKRPAAKAGPPPVGEMWDALPYFESTLERTSELAVKAHCGGGWSHPRDSHAARLTRMRRGGTAIRGTEHPPTLAQDLQASFGETSPERPSVAKAGPHVATAKPEAVVTPEASARPIDRRTAESMSQALDLLQTLRRWGIKTLGALAALPPGEVYERLGARGVAWQRLARGEDTSPMVPWIPEDPFESSLALEWPIEGLEPLSFVLGRLLEPLSARLEQADRGAAILHTHLRLVSKEVHARTVQLPAPMRDAKTLRTLVLLDLETNPPSAAVDEVRLLIEPTPARVVQWTLYERAQPSPEQTSTLIARLTALMGDGHVGSPQLVDSWKPALFAMTPFEVRPPTAGMTSGAMPHATADPQPEALGAALRRFRLPVPARVQMQEGRPVRITTDRRGVAGGSIVQAAGPWRTSGDWWNDAPRPSLAVNLASSGETAPKRPSAAKASPTCWDRDEWDVAIADGTVYRLYVERGIGQWFLDGIVD